MTVQKIELENLLFSVVNHDEGASATEALLSFGVFDTWDTVKPLFPQNQVGKPIPVMVEGAYFVRQGDKYRKVEFTAEDIKRLASKQPRDVPFNYDHRRAPGPEGVKGWLRFGKDKESGTELHYVGSITSPSGQTLTALFATPELGEEARGYITNGTYRDVSIEYRPVDDVVTGCALTSYPVMRNLQFSELEGAEPDPEPDQSQEVQASEIQEENEMDINKIKELPAEQRKELAGLFLAEFGLTPQAIEAIQAENARNAELNAKNARELALTKAEKAINDSLGQYNFGVSDELADKAQAALAWVDTQTELQFGEEGGAPDVAEVITELFSVIASRNKVIEQLGGDAEALDTEGEVQMGEVEPADENLNMDTVSKISKLAQQYL